MDIYKSLLVVAELGDAVVLGVGGDGLGVLLVLDWLGSLNVGADGRASLDITLLATMDVSTNR